MRPACGGSRRECGALDPVGAPTAMRLCAIGALALAGCSAGLFPACDGRSLQAHHGACDPAGAAIVARPLAAADGAVPIASAQAPLPEVHPRWWAAGALGVEFGAYSFRKKSFNDWFGDAPYVGLRYGLELSLNTAISLSVGYFAFPTEVHDGEDIEGVPLRFQVELGSHLGPTQSRWYIAAGGGYNVCERRPSEGMEDLWPALPEIESGWLGQVVSGLEFRNSTPLVARVELGHVWVAGSGADMWSSTGTISYQF